MRLILAVVLLCSACGDDGPPAIDANVPPADAEWPTGAVQTEVLTFNVGLLQTVIGSSVRIPHIVDAVKASTAEIICFNEVWIYATTPEEFHAMFADEYPYAIYDSSQTEEFSPLSNGLLIASKYPIQRTRFLRYAENDDIVDRAVIAGTVIKEGDWHLNVLCTHLQAGLDGGQEDPPPPTSNAGIRAAQLAELNDFVEDNGYAAGPSLLLGDFNAGPDPDPTDDECPGQAACPSTCTPTDSVTVATAVEAGWDDRAADLGFVDCTYCMPEARVMEYVPLYPCEGSQRIDHILSRGLAPSEVTSIVRDMEDAIDEAVPGDASNRHVYTLSDHYAVHATIE